MILFRKHLNYFHYIEISFSFKNNKFLSYKKFKHYCLYFEQYYYINFFFFQIYFVKESDLPF